MSKYDDLERLQKLKESGTITASEYNREKANILNENDKKNNNMKAVKILFIITVICALVTAIVIFLSIHYSNVAEDSIDELLKNQLIGKEDKELSRKNELVADLSTTFLWGGLIGLIATSITFLAGSIIKLIKSRKDRKTITIFIVKIVTMIIIDILVFLFLGTL